MRSSASRTAGLRADLPLAVAWVLTAVGVGVVGWLLFALSEATAERALGAVLSIAALLCAGLGAGLLLGPVALRRWSPPLSAVLVVLGLGAAVVLLRGTAVFVSDVLLVVGPPLIGGGVTAVLARRGR